MLRRPFFWIIALVIAVFAAAPVDRQQCRAAREPGARRVYITLASNLNLMLGYAGYINFGSIVFFGLGGYICVWLVSAYAWSLAASLIAAGVGVAVLSFMFGVGILRLRGPFFALATIGIVEARAGFCREFHAVGRLVRHLYLAAGVRARSAARRRRCG